MSLLQESQIDNSVYICTFQCLIRQATIAMKFPCSYFVQWTTSSGKSVVATPKHRPQQNHVYFDQKLNLTTQMIYNHSTLEYSKKETLAELFLVSKSRPDQNKLVGRVTIDLAKVINVEMYAQPTQFKLNFCSVEGSLIMQFKLIDQKLTSMKVQDLDRSSFIDYISQTVLKQPKAHPLSSLRNSDAPQRQRSNTSNLQTPSHKISNDQDVQVLSPHFVSTNVNYLPIRNGASPKAESKQKVENRFVSKQKDKFNSTLHPLNKGATFGQGSQIITESLQFEQINSRRLEMKQRGEKQEISGLLKSSSSKNVMKLNPQIVIAQELQQNLHNNKQEPQAIKTRDILAEKATKIESITNKQIEHIQSFKENIINDTHKAYELKKEPQEHKYFIENKMQLENSDKMKFQLLLKSYSQKEQNLTLLQQKYNLEIESKNSIIIQIKNELIQKNNKFQELQTSFQQLQQKYRTVSQFNSNTDIDNNYLQQRLASYQEQINQLNKNLIEYQGREAIYEQKFVNLQQMIKNLEEAVQKSNNQLAIEEKNKLQLSNKIKQLEKINTQYENKTENKDNQSQQQVVSIKLALAQKVQQINLLAAQNQQLETNYKALFAQYQIILRKYEDKQIQYDLLKIQDQKLVEQQPQFLQQHKETDIQIQSGLGNELQEQIMRLNQQIQFLRASLEMLQKQSTQQIQALMTENNTLLQKLQTIELKNSELSTVIDDKKQLDKTKNVQQDLQKYLDQIKSLKQKIDTYTKLLQEEKAKNIQFSRENQRNAEKLSFYQQHLQTVQNENHQLKHTINQLSSTLPSQDQPKQQYWQEGLQEYEMRIDKLNFNLEEQINQNNELSETIIKYMEKQAKMKQTLTILEQQSKEIFILFQQKEHNQETYQKMIEDLQREMNRLKTNFYQIHSQTQSSNKNIPFSPKSSQKFIQISNNGRDDRDQTINKLHKTNNDLREDLLKLDVRCSDIKLKSQAQIQKLTQQLIESSNLCNKLKQNSGGKIELQKSFKDKELEIQIWKSRNKENEEAKNKFETELDTIKKEIEFIEEERFGLQSFNNEKDIKILQLEQEISNLANQIQIRQVYSMDQNQISIKLQQFYTYFREIKDKIMTNTLSSEWESLMKNILDRTLGGQEASKLINIQQKSRLLSKQLQKLKAHLLKSQSKNQQQKLTYMTLIKRCQSIISELITAAESLNLNQSSFL